MDRNTTADLQNGLEITPRKTPDNRIGVIALRGNVDLFHADLLREELKTALRTLAASDPEIPSPPQLEDDVSSPPLPTLIVDFRQVEYCDSAGAGLLLKANQWLSNVPGHLLLIVKTDTQPERLLKSLVTKSGPWEIRYSVPVYAASATHPLKQILAGGASEQEAVF